MTAPEPMADKLALLEAENVILREALSSVKESFEILFSENDFPIPQGSIAMGCVKGVFVGVPKQVNEALSSTHASLRLAERIKKLEAVAKAVDRQMDLEPEHLMGPIIDAISALNEEPKDE